MSKMHGFKWLTLRCINAISYVLLILGKKNGFRHFMHSHHKFWLAIQSYRLLDKYRRYIKVIVNGQSIKAKNKWINFGFIVKGESDLR